MKHAVKAGAEEREAEKLKMRFKSKLSRVSRGASRLCLSRLTVNCLATSEGRERWEPHTYGYSRRAVLQTVPSINPGGEAHHTSCHLGHSFLSGGGSGCTLEEVAYGRIPAREVVAPAGKHPLVLGDSLSDPC